MVPAMRGYTADTDAVLKRLRRIEGQVRGLQRMVEEHMNHCVRQAVAAGEPDADAKMAEAAAAVARLVRS